MSRGMRGTVVGLALLCVLTACSGESNDDPGSPGDETAATPLNPSQLSQAMPSKVGAPEGWRGREPQVLDGAEARKLCEQQATASCAGVTALGSAIYNLEASSDTHTRFTLLAYDSVDNAKAGYKTLVADDKEDAGTAAKALDLQPGGADDIYGYTKDGASVAEVRVGTVLASIAGRDLPNPDDLQTLVTLQVDRIKTAATGKNPDA